MYQLHLKVAVFFLLLCTAAIAIKPIKAQNGIGGGLIYNFQAENFGIGLRGEFPLKNIKFLDGLSLVPQASYFPWFQTVSEFYIGSAVHLGFFSLKKWRFYGLINLSYNGWINYDDSGKDNARFSNMGIEGGLGITRSTCWRPFLEFRYNALFREANVQLGLIYTIKCERRGSLPCPKIPPQPMFKE